jgi:hypothetical protein
MQELEPTQLEPAPARRTQTRTAEENLFGAPRRVGESQKAMALRNATPTKALQNAAKTKLPVGSPDPVFPGRTVTGTAEADHIVAFDRIRQKPGFAAIADEKRQIEILNHPPNFEPLSPYANESKGKRSYAEWAQDLRAEGIKFNDEYMNRMIAKERELDAVIDTMIRDSERWGTMPPAP